MLETVITTRKVKKLSVDLTDVLPESVSYYFSNEK